MRTAIMGMGVDSRREAHEKSDQRVALKNRAERHWNLCTFLDYPWQRLPRQARLAPPRHGATECRPSPIRSRYWWLGGSSSALAWDSGPNPLWPTAQRTALPIPNAVGRISRLTVIPNVAQPSLAASVAGWKPALRTEPTRSSPMAQACCLLHRQSADAPNAVDHMSPLQSEEEFTCSLGGHNHSPKNLVSMFFEIPMRRCTKSPLSRVDRLQPQLKTTIPAA
jgi:hypothetical protein